MINNFIIVFSVVAVFGAGFRAIVLNCKPPWFGNAPSKLSRQ